MKKRTIEDMQRIAKEIGGKCLSDVYIGNKAKLNWQCVKGHVFFSKPNDIQQGHRCPECAKYERSKSLRDTIENMQKLATRFGGKCLSLKYMNSTTNLEWECKYGHKFKIAPVKVKYGQWCPFCRSRLVGEKICRAYFEAIFEKRFEKWRPKDLLSIKDTILEFDGYNSDLNLAFEYHGAQHYFPVKMFTRKRTFDDQKTTDAYKIGYCMVHLIHFIEVPYTISYKNMGRFIIQEAEKKGFKIPKDKQNIDYHTFKIYVNDAITELQELANEKGGKCLSVNYVDNLTELEFECKQGHIWKTTPKMIKRGHWCHYCAGNVRKSFDDVQKTVELKKGTILEGNYVNNRSKFLIKCEKDHKFSTNYHELASGRWCLRCSRLFPLTIEEMQKIAIEREGFCLSEKYINAQTRLEWQCSKGHKWLARPTQIKRGGWCPFCSKRVKLTIEEMRDLAKQKEGFCLSEKYVDNKTKLLWECKQGHEWWQKPEHIKNGHWCPKCAKKK